MERSFFFSLHFHLFFLPCLLFCFAAGVVSPATVIESDEARFWGVLVDDAELNVK